MAQQRIKNRRPAVTRGGEPARPWRPDRWVFSLLAIAFLLYLIAHALLRSAGGRVWLTDRLSAVLDTPVRIAEARFTPWLDIELRGLESIGQTLDGSGPLLHGERVRLSWRSQTAAGRWQFHWHRLEVWGGQVILQETATGDWEPRVLAKLAGRLARGGGLNWRGPGVPVPVSAPSVPRPPPTAAPAPRAAAPAIEVRWHDGALRWYDAAGQRLAEVNGLDLSYTPLAAAGRHFEYLEAHIRSAVNFDNRSVTNLHAEAVSTDGHHFLLHFDGDWQ